MIDVEAILAGDTDMRTAIHAELVAQTCAKLGYTFDADRLNRINVESREFMDVGASFPRAFSHALELELRMYGDPHSNGEPIGILGVVK